MVLKWLAISCDAGRRHYTGAVEVYEDRGLWISFVLFGRLSWIGHWSLLDTELFTLVEWYSGVTLKWQVALVTLGGETAYSPLRSPRTEVFKLVEFYVEDSLEMAIQVSQYRVLQVSRAVLRRWSWNCHPSVTRCKKPYIHCSGSLGHKGLSW